LATHGRPGPVWLDIPLDIQGASINESDLLRYDETEDALDYDNNDLKEKVSQSIELLKKAERPIIIAGHGIRIAGAQQLLLNIVAKMGIPVVSSMNGFDIITTDNPLFVGRIGTIADRAGNFAVQNCDLLVSIGSRNNIRQISYNCDDFARAATKIVVDIDEAELKKPTIIPDLPIHADAGDFLRELAAQIEHVELPIWINWTKWCIDRKVKYPVVLPEYREIKKFVNPYYFTQVLCRCMEENAAVVAGNGTTFLALFQAGIVKTGQRYIWNSGCASMGYDLPAAIGACIAMGKKDIICVAGDGSMQMNIQELQTIAHHNLPIKIFVLNNEGYISIKQTQDNYFKGLRVACDEKSGISFPDIAKIATAYGLPWQIIDEQQTMQKKITDILNTPGPLICEVRLILDYKFSPRNASEQKADGRMISKPLEDLFPFLDREEFASNMIIPMFDPTE
jgi:acetolactate synthase-1/2/3 large subunit